MKENKLSDQWRTPQDLFDILNKGGVYQGIEFTGFNFDIDLCATRENSKCRHYYKDYLNNIASLDIKTYTHEHILTDWDLSQGTYSAAFMNPPYSNPRPFIEKAWEDSKYCTIVCLVKCDPSTQWWATFWDYTNRQLTLRVNESDFGINTELKTIRLKPGARPGCDYLFFPKRIKFDPPQELINSGEVYQLGCKKCGGKGGVFKYNFAEMAYCDADEPCMECNGAGKRSKWVQKCKACRGSRKNTVLMGNNIVKAGTSSCYKCRGKGYVPLSGPAFSCALVIMDRRYV